MVMELLRVFVLVLCAANHAAQADGTGDEVAHLQRPIAFHNMNQALARLDQVLFGLTLSANGSSSSSSSAAKPAGKSASTEAVPTSKAPPATMIITVNGAPDSWDDAKLKTFKSEVAKAIGVEVKDVEVKKAQHQPPKKKKSMGANIRIHGASAASGSAAEHASAASTSSSSSAKAVGVAKFQALAADTDGAKTDIEVTAPKDKVERFEEKIQAGEVQSIGSTKVDGVTFRHSSHDGEEGEEEKVDCARYRSEALCIRRSQCKWKPTPESSLTSAYGCFEHGGVMEYLPHSPIQWIASIAGIVIFVLVGSVYCYIESPMLC